MLRFVLKKLAGFVAIVLATCAIVFACVSTVPAASMPAGGLAGWLGRIVIGDFGTSQQGGSIGARIAASLAVTLPLALMALILATALGAGAGFTLALVLMAGLREQLEFSEAPKIVRGTIITLLLAGILSLSFMGFSGLGS